ncbi:hypothetical protein Mgra_00006060 [Meloidogyne graminicola]|uniref:Neurotransmitter-gated ion-channel ligand-binding domain-containing protein n=1 Tax=Meloidogyne graminicola TaxID=189291 RepID=A0A8S9ZM17_9BILA|nr:hypothetical protein Mgra_00006060 [Meloidogyne graminicola]
MLTKLVFVIMLSFNCLAIANLKLNIAQSVDHEENNGNEPDEVRSDDLKCQNWKGRNTTDDEELMDEQFTELEDCIWNSLITKEHINSPRQIHPLLRPPQVLKFSVENLVVEQVDTLSRSSMEFFIFGHLLLSWNDSRLQWNKSEWPLEGISLEEERRHEIWTPDFLDESNCGTNEGCMAKVGDLSVTSTGQVLGRLLFRFPSFCRIDYRSYPEEKNDCCLFLGLADTGRIVEFTVGSKSKFSTLEKQVHVRRHPPGTS